MQRNSSSGKERQRMKKALTSNLSLKILSVLVACIIWISVMDADDPERKVAYDVAVEIRNSDSFGVDKTFSVEEDTDEVRVWVKARESVLSKLQAKDFKVVADMRNVTAGNAVPYTVECTNGTITKANWECEPASMKIKIEDVVEESFGIETGTTGTPAKGYDVGKVKLSEGDTITISGAESLVSIIHKVSVTFGVNGMSESKKVSGTLTITDGNGAVFTKSQMENLNITTASGVLVKDGVLEAKVELWKVQSDIRLEVGTTGKPAWGYRVSDIKVIPETVSLAGDEKTLKELDGVLTLEDAVSIANASESFTTEAINLEDYLKEKYKGKLKLQGGSATTVSVKVTMEKLGTKKIDIPISALTIKGRPLNMDMVLTPADKVSIEVAAIKGSLSDLSLEDIVAVLDLSSYKEAGRYEIPIDITLPDGYELEADVTMVVNLTEKETAVETTIEPADNNQG